MSYDLRFAVKAENGAFVNFKSPEYDTPTYNIGTIFRKSMNFDFEQGEYYRVSEIYDHIMLGIKELTINQRKYKQYEPENGWGSVGSALECLKSVNDAIEYIVEWYELPLDVVYLAW